ncbi:hypothetical protein BH23BAC1_BH23BAC1_37360 [soil metagenome]
MRILITFLIAFFIFSGCRKEDDNVIETCISERVVDQLILAEGIIVLIGNTWVIDVNTPQNSGRYFACNFPENLKIENQTITFDANVFEIPPNMRLVGTPIIITRIY